MPRKDDLWSYILKYTHAVFVMATIAATIIAVLLLFQDWYAVWWYFPIVALLWVLTILLRRLVNWLDN